MTRTAHLTAPIIPVDADTFLIRADLIVRGKREGYWAERDESRANLAATVADIVAGQVERVRRVIRFNIATFSCEDASEEVARAMLRAALADRQGIPDHLVDFLEEHLGCDAVASAEREDA